ncbi:hypothetical protein AGIG_G1107 [Arapaima gigas]
MSSAPACSATVLLALLVFISHASADDTGDPGNDTSIYRQPMAEMSCSLCGTKGKSAQEREWPFFTCTEENQGKITFTFLASQ